jgi:arylsulfatase A-like enzyme
MNTKKMRFNFTMITMLVLGVAGAVPGFGAASPLPNIIVFQVDDMGQGDSSAYQDITRNEDVEQIHTPTMEILARNGVRFIDGHSPASVCNPSRIGILRGGRPVATYEEMGPTMPSMLQRAGYRTYGIGKWHVFFEPGEDYHAGTPIRLSPVDMGFHHYTGTEHNIGHSPAFCVDRTYMKYDVATKKLVPNDSKEAPGYGSPGGPHESICQQVWLNAARDYMQRHVRGGKDASKPFFLYYASHANHKKYYPASDLDGIQVAGACKTVDGRLLKETRNTLILERSEMVLENDIALKLLLKWLNSTDDPRNPGKKMLENTLFVFTSDNGGNDEEHSSSQGKFLRGRKTVIHEGGHRVPFLISWPKRVPKGKTCIAQISSMDLFATFAAVTGQKLADDEAPDSFNVLEAMLKPDVKNVRPEGVFAWRKLKDGVYMVRDDAYKLIWNRGKKDRGDVEFTELYNLDRDIGEIRNLLGNPEYKAVEKRLKAKANQLMKADHSR